MAEYIEGRLMSMTLPVLMLLSHSSDSTNAPAQFMRPSHSTYFRVKQTKCPVLTRLTSSGADRRHPAPLPSSDTGRKPCATNKHSS